jgi:hypothetical protein
MAATAFQVQYRQEFIAGFEQRQALLRDTVTTEAEVKGNQATFLIADSGDATAVTRGVDGLIPSRNDDLTQTTATLVEWHDLVKKSNFNVESSQGNQRAIMQQTSMAVVNRKIDSDILTTLLTGTVTWGSATTASLAAVMVAQTKEFASVEYVNSKPTDGNDLAWRDRPMNYRWQGVNWIVHPNISGKATAAERCFMYHKSAIGHAVHSQSIEAVAGYDSEQAYSWARTTIHMGSVLLQNTGVVELTHDGSAFA